MPPHRLHVNGGFSIDLAELPDPLRKVNTIFCIPVRQSA